MFWGLKVDSEEKISSPRSFHVSQVALDLNSCENAELTQLWIRDRKQKCLLATLHYNIPQVKLDLAIEKNEEVTFFPVGVGSLYLSGYYIPEDDPNQEQQLDEQAINSAKTEEKTPKDPEDDPNQEQQLDEQAIHSAKTEQKTPKELEEGVVVTDVVRGKGKKAKLGDTVNIYFENRLESNNSIVGRKQNEDGLKFTLGGVGDATVIRGWHIGVIGMRKGGKRNITCPPKVAYGDKGLSFCIPPNSTIISEVQLLSIQRNTEGS